MVQLRQATASLRLVLADLMGKEDQLETMIRQFRTQLDRLPRQAIYGRTTLDLALSAMAEIQERLDHAKLTRQHLLAIVQKATDELRALELTQQIEEAKCALEELIAQAQPAGQTDEKVAAEVRRLEEFIAEHSKQAERDITSSFQERYG